MKIFSLIATAAGVSVGILVVFFKNNDDSSFLRHHRSRLGLVYDPRTTVLKPPLEQLPKCPLRNLAAFKNGRVGRKYFDAVPKTLEGSNCLFFDCTNDVNECDNGDPTNYDGPKPPCCTHVLRDMHRIFDEEMCSLGLDYFAAFGSLLGLRRADRFIPWSIDGDLIIHSTEAMNALVMLWDSGGLMKWAHSEDRYRKELDEWDRNWDSGFPYMDLYLGRSGGNGKLLELGAGGHKCLHYYKDVFPTERKLVYNGQFTMNFPPNPDQLLRTNYGNGWRFPPSEKDKKEHGGRMCPYGPAQK
eukprot:scaffold8242_cov130-Skeletonema_dohrnii-CCMP3373.AAC.2